MVEAGAFLLLSHVPLAEVCGPVTGLTEEGGVGDGVQGEGGAVIDDPISVVVFSGQEGSPARGAERVGHEGIAEADPFLGHAIHGGSLEPGEAGDLSFFLKFTLDDTHGIPALVIGDQEDEIRARFCDFVALLGATGPGRGGIL
jgi:hypothetical protein